MTTYPLTAEELQTTWPPELSNVIWKRETRVDETVPEVSTDSLDIQAMEDAAPTRFRRADSLDSHSVEFVSTPRDFEAENLQARLFTLSLSQRMADEGVAEPTVQCRLIAARLAVALYEDHRIVPERIAPNVEEGLTLSYFNYRSGTALVIEVYNTTEIAALLNRGQAILSAQDIRSIDDPNLSRMVESFKESDTSPAT